MHRMSLLGIATAFALVGPGAIGAAQVRDAILRDAVARDAEAEAAAERALLNAGDAGDGEGTIETLKLPSRLHDGGRWVLGGPGCQRWTAVEFRPQMRQRENWHVSTIDALEASIVTRVSRTVLRPRLQRSHM